MVRTKHQFSAAEDLPVPLVRQAHPYDLLPAVPIPTGRRFAFRRICQFTNPNVFPESLLISISSLYNCWFIKYSPGEEAGALLRTPVRTCALQPAGTRRCCDNLNHPTRIPRRFKHGAASPLTNDGSFMKIPRQPLMEDGDDHGESASGGTNTAKESAMAMRGCSPRWGIRVDSPPVQRQHEGTRPILPRFDKPLSPWTDSGRVATAAHLLPSGAGVAVFFETYRREEWWGWSAAKDVQRGGDSVASNHERRDLMASSIPPSLNSDLIYFQEIKDIPQ